MRRASNLVLVLLLLGLSGFAVTENHGGTNGFLENGGCFVRVLPEIVDLGIGYVIGEEFRIAVVFEEISNVGGFDVQFSWNTTYLDYVDHILTAPFEDYPDPQSPSPYGGILHPPPLPLRDDVDSDNGTYRAAFATIGGPYFNGSGTAFTMTFQVTNQSDTDVEVILDIKTAFISGVMMPPLPEIYDGVVKIPRHPEIVPDDHPTIQAAINNASDGDAIFVRNGTYYENVILNKTVSLIGESRNTTISGGDGRGNVVYVAADNTLIKRFTITNNIIPDNSTSGIYLFNREKVTITDLRVEGFIEGIILNASTHIMIQHSILTDNGKGIRLEESSETTILENDISQNAGAILLRSSSNNTITKNNIINNGMGISLFFYNSWYNTIAENYFRNNDVYAISLYKCSNTTITRNVIAGYCPYTCCGIRLSQASNNLIYHNSFLHNTIQVVSDKSVNLWENSYLHEGNYWSDYGGVDSDGDKIGDSPYVIDENNTDHFPLTQPLFWWSPGDVNYDFTVDIFDAVLFVAAYKSTPSDPNWNPHCDITEPYEFIDIFDVVMMAGDYGEEYEP